MRIIVVQSAHLGVIRVVIYREKTLSLSGYVGICDDSVHP